MRKHIFLILFIYLSVSVYSQPELEFIRYTTQQGLAYNDVLSICQDSIGFMWFGTKDGCSRFDGIEFKNYQYDEDISGSIGPGWVNQIVCDKNNRLWFTIAATEGSVIMQYNYETDEFTDFSQIIKEQLNVTDKSLSFWNIFIDSDGYLWFTLTNQGFAYYNPKNNEVKTLVSKYDVTELTPQSFFEDRDKNIWFSTMQGAFKYNKQTDLFTRYNHNPDNPNSLSSDNCTRVYQDSEKQIWIGTYNGLNKLIPSSSGAVEFEHILHDPRNPFTLSSNLVYDIIEDNNNNLLIATVNGLCLIDKKNGKIYRYFNNEIDDESINSNLVRSVYRDKQKNIWIVTNSGVGKLHVKNFKSFSQSIYKNSISHNKVQYLCEAPNSDIWIATPRGIDVFNKKDGTFHFITGVNQNKGGLYGAPLTICSDNKGMWIGTWNGGLSRIDLVTQKHINYNVDKLPRNTTNIFSLFLDSKNRLWIGVLRKGIFVYNKKTGEYKSFSHDSKNENTLSSNLVLNITEDSESNIWIGTQSGLNLLLDFESGVFKRYFNEVDIKCVTEGSDGNLWFGTNMGLFSFNKKSQRSKKIDSNNGLPGNSVFGILEDLFQDLWISTNKGFARLKLPDDSIPKITVYHREEGTDIGEFLDRSCTKLSDGTMMYGGTEGFFMFDPKKIKTDSLPPKVIFTSLRIANKAVEVNQDINGQIILEKSITITERLALNYKNNTFSIEFAGLQYNMPQYNQYCYRLDGYDPIESGWHYAKIGDRRIEYMNLPRGHYVLKVKAANSYGIWNNQTKELEILISPPWWQTIWFIFTVVLLLVLIFILVVRRRTHNLQKQKQKLEKIVEQRTVELKSMNVVLKEGKEELETQMEQMAKMNEKLETKTIQIENMAKQLHEADQSKLRFFANVSHEFRTPLSLIIAPLEKISKLKQPVLWDNVNISDYHQLMLKNSKRLLRLINQVIDFRKIEHGEKTLNITNNNINEFVEEVVSIFSTYAEQKNISLKLESQHSTIDFWFDSDFMEKILYNLISNAIKYTNEGGEVTLQLTVNSNQSADNEELIINNEKLDNKNTNDNKFTIHNSSFLIIKVSDTGIGIKKEELDKIFDRFYRAETSEGVADGGTGIGLAYTKELVQLHKGTISVESEQGNGTTFTVTLPLGKDHFNQENINNVSSPASLNYTRSMIETYSGAEVVKARGQENEGNVGNSLEGSKPNILVVEDNTDLRRFIKDELSSKFNVYEATNGKEGLELANNIEPELIISDIMMPVMDGIELCKKIKTDENTSHIPLILLTAKGSEDDQIKGLETGADDYISKPFNIDILKIKIHNSFLLRKRMQEKFSQSINIVPSEITHSKIDQQFLQRAIEVVNENMGDYEFGIDAFVTHMNYSRALVYRKIKNITGKSVSEFIYSIRLKTAAQLFSEGHSNVKEVCYKVGFKHPNTFSEYFSKAFGKSPRAFIKDIRKE